MRTLCPPRMLTLIYTRQEFLAMHIAAAVLAIIATIFYTGETVATDTKLSHVNSMLLTFLVGIGSAIISGSCLLIRPPETLAMPSRSEIGWVAVIIACTFFADWFHFMSLEMRAGAIVLCTSYALMPLFSSMMEFKLPSKDLVGAWVSIAFALFFILRHAKTN